MPSPKTLRMECCKNCEGFVDDVGKGPHGFRPHCGAVDGEPMELHDEVLAGPADTCPKNKWSVIAEDPPDTSDYKRLKDLILRVEASEQIPADRECAIAVLVATKRIKPTIGRHLHDELCGGD